MPRSPCSRLPPRTTHPNAKCVYEESKEIQEDSPTKKNIVGNYGQVREGRICRACPQKSSRSKHVYVPMTAICDHRCCARYLYTRMKNQDGHCLRGSCCCTACWLCRWVRKNGLFITSYHKDESFGRALLWRREDNTRLPPGAPPYPLSDTIIHIYGPCKRSCPFCFRLITWKPRRIEHKNDFGRNHQG